MIQSVLWHDGFLIWGLLNFYHQNFIVWRMFLRPTGFSYPLWPLLIALGWMIFFGAENEKTLSTVFGGKCLNKVMLTSSLQWSSGSSPQSFLEFFLKYTNCKFLLQKYFYKLKISSSPEMFYTTNFYYIHVKFIMCILFVFLLKCNFLNFVCFIMRNWILICKFYLNLFRWVL